MVDTPRSIEGPPLGTGPRSATSYEVPVDPEFLPREVTQDAAGYEEYGYSTAIDSDLVAIGAPSTNAFGVDLSGAVQVTDLATQKHLYLIGQLTTDGRFGASVALGKGLVVVGAPGDYSPPASIAEGGAVYVFNATTGAEVAYLGSDNPVTGGDFGSSVAIAWPYVVVGAPGEDVSGESLEQGSGAAYVFDLATNTSMTFFSPYPVENGGFGAAVAISGNRIVVGAPLEDPCPGPGKEVCAGNAYVFSVTDGDLLAQLPNSLGGEFGSAVAIDGATVLVGAPRTDTTFGETGEAAVFTLGSARSLNLTSPHPVAGGLFGSAVAVSGDVAVVGEPHGDPDYLTEAGDLYTFSTVSGDLYRSVLVSDPVRPLEALGWSVGISGTTVVGGAPFQNDSDGPGTGAVFLYQALPTTISSPTNGEGEYGGEFASAVAIANGIMVVGAEDSGSTFDAGQAFLVNTGTGAFTPLYDPYSTTGGNFGATVAIDGAYAVVGAPGEPTNGTGPAGSGMAYVYSVATGGLVRALPSPVPQFEAHFGNSVSISGDLVAVGAYHETPASQSGDGGAGSAYLFNGTTAVRLANFTSSNPTSLGYFGWSVALSGEWLVAGAPGETVGAYNDAGDAYIFTPILGGHSYTSKLLSSPAAQVDGEFGSSVALGGGTVVVGADGEAQNGTASVGHAYVYGLTGVLVTVLHSSAPSDYGSFGSSVSTDGATVVVGAPGEVGDGYDEAGNAYVFSWTGALVDRYFSAQAQVSGLFGTTVDIGPGGIVVVGAPGEGGETGYAYIL